MRARNGRRGVEMTATKTNELPGTRAFLRDSRMSASKAREVLNLIRGMEYTRARDVVAHVDRGAAIPIAKLLRSCAANAEHNEGLDPTELYIASCYADEGTTLKRWRPRARGRATRIRKRTCHITIILARMPEERLARQRAKSAAEQADRRARRVAGARRREAALPTKSEAAATEVAEEPTEIDGSAADAVETDAAETDAVEVEAEATDEVSTTIDETEPEVVAVDATDDAETASESAEDPDPSETSTEEGAN